MQRSGRMRNSVCPRPKAKRGVHLEMAARANISPIGGGLTMELSRGEQQVAVKSLISSLNSISALDDRSAALVAFSHLEGALQQAVANKLICCDDTEIYNRLFQDGPLSSFYSQMLCGRALGMFGPKTYKDLDNLRKIRNHFAHGWKCDTFESDSIRDRCKNITLPEWAPKVKHKWGLEDKYQEPPVTPIDLYTGSCLRYWNAFANVLLDEESFPLE